MYIKQPEGFVSKGQSYLVCKINKSMYMLKQSSCQWYFKFKNVIFSYGFVKIVVVVVDCIYLKFSGSQFIFLVLYVNDILLSNSDLTLLSKHYLSNNFDPKDRGEASYAIGIEVHSDISEGKLYLSQRAYIKKMHNNMVWKASKLALRLMIRVIS
jgi:hypothetical protein